MYNMSILTFDSIDIPYVSAVSLDRNIIGEGNRTSRGKYRSDTITTKREWQIETHPIKLSEARNLTDYLDSINWGSGTVSFDEIDGTTQAYIREYSEEREQFLARDGSGWQADGRSLTFTIREV